MANHPSLLTEEDLSAWLNYERRGDIERKLREAGVPFWYGQKGRIVTTLEQINAAISNGADFGDIQFGDAANGPDTRKAG